MTANKQKFEWKVGLRLVDKTSKRCFFNKYTQRQTKNSHRPQVVWSIIPLFVCITKTYVVTKSEASEKIPVACTEINNTVCFHFFIFYLYFGPWLGVCHIFTLCVYFGAWLIFCVYSLQRYAFELRWGFECWWCLFEFTQRVIITRLFVLL